MRGFKALLIIGLLLVSMGCGKKDYTKEPAAMHWDRDMCERCKMAISERKFAVQAVDRKGRVYKFDDIGCLILWQHLEHPEIKFAKIWIKDAKSGKWIDARSAKYVAGLVTPMGYGFGAYENPPKGKKVLSFEEVKQKIIKIGR